LRQAILEALMAARKSTKVSKRGSVKARKKRTSTKRAAGKLVAIEPGATLSPYGKVVLRAFDAGVQKAYARMARAGIAATVMVDGKIIRAVPVREGQRFVVREPQVADRPLRRAGR
jgi:hypothetical protein